MKIFLSGPITKDPNYKEHFAKVETKLKKMGHVVLNPAIYPSGLTNPEYMMLGFKMLEIADAVCMLDGWEYSTGASIEFHYANYLQKTLIYYNGGGFIFGN